MTLFQLGDRLGTGEKSLPSETLTGQEKGGANSRCRGEKKTRQRARAHLVTANGEKDVRYLEKTGSKDQTGGEKRFQDLVARLFRKKTCYGPGFCPYTSGRKTRKWS